MVNVIGERDNNIFIYDRNRAELSGIDEVLEFSERSVVLCCKTGNISIEGNMLRICSFDSASGSLLISGTIDSVFYFGDADESKRSKRRRSV